MLLTFREIQRQVQAKIQNTVTSTTLDNDLRPKIKDFINDRYARIYRSYFFQEVQGQYDLTLIASQTEYVFNDDVEPNGIISIFDKTNGITIDEIGVQEHDTHFAPEFDRTSNILVDNPDKYRLTGVNTVKASTSVAEKVSVVSSVAADITPNIVRVEGFVGGIWTGEDITITGTTTADSTLTYDANQKLQVCTATSTGVRKTLTGGITVSGKTSSTVFAKISPHEYAHRYQWFKVSPTPRASGTQPTWEIKYKKYFRELINDSDIPLFDCCIELVQGAYADALYEDGLETQGNRADQKFVTMVQELQSTRPSKHKVDQLIPFNRNQRTRENFPYRWV